MYRSITNIFTCSGEKYDCKTLPVRAYISIENKYKYGNISAGDSYLERYVYNPVK
jgi:hypothetical protein